MTLAPAICHRRQVQQLLRYIRARSGSNPVEKGELSTEVNLNARGYLQPHILEDIGTATPTPRCHGFVSLPQQGDDLGAKQSEHGADPAVENSRPADLSNREAV